ncbi:NAD(P)/FAD-dependent oxidoreductase [Gordonia sp. NPDC003950]
MTDEVECVVVGAGVVGLAVARRLARDGREVVIVESEDAIGTKTSSRNSEVIHSGIYYPRGSLKARACVAGREMLYRYCAEAGVAHRRFGKLIVATTEDQRPQLQRIIAAAHANGVTDLRLVEGPELAEMEPDLSAVAAVLSPSTGIVDGHGLMQALRRDAEDAGASVVVHSPLVAGEIGADATITVELGDSFRVRCATLVNCAGLGAWDVAAALDGFPPGQIPSRRFAKGNYFGLDHGTAPFSRLIYPVPVAGGLGIHLTLDLDGRARFGPDVEWLGDVDPAQIDLSVDPHRVDTFTEEIRWYWPGLPDHALHPDYSGVRPKISGPGDPDADFAVRGPSDHGIPGLVHLFGIESPGLTSSLALADEVAARLRP